MKTLYLFGASLMLLLAPLVAHAADGYVTINLNMRAGPDPGYPLITTIPEGSPVSVQGCTSGFEWCDVISRDDRGWVAGDYIQYEYQDQRVALPSYGARIGIPIVSFVISSYWNNHYRNRSFYRQRNSWYHRPMPHRPPPRPVARPPSHRPPTQRPTPRPRPTGHSPAPSRPSADHGQRASPRPSTHRPSARPAPSAASRPPSRPATPSRDHGKPTPAERPAGKRAEGNKGNPDDKHKSDKDNHGH